MATKLLTLASFATLTLASSCQVAPAEPRREPLTPVTIAATPIATPEFIRSEPLAAPILASEKVSIEKVSSKLRVKKPRPAALIVPTPAIATPLTLIEETTPAPSLRSQLSEVVTPRVDKDERPATGNVVSRRSNNR
jgi:hypothetical protein